MLFIQFLRIPIKLYLILVVSIKTCIYLPAALFEAPSTNNPTFD